MNEEQVQAILLLSTLVFNLLYGLLVAFFGYEVAFGVLIMIAYAMMFMIFWADV